jgi:hypothetical protein
VAVSNAALVGANFITVEQDDCDPVQALESMVKSELPVIATVENVVEPPALVTPIESVVFAPTTRLPKLRLVGLKLNTGGETPVPEMETLCGLAVALSVYVSVPDFAPVEVGVK